MRCNKYDLNITGCSQWVGEVATKDCTLCEKQDQTKEESHDRQSKTRSTRIGGGHVYYHEETFMTWILKHQKRVSDAQQELSGENRRLQKPIRCNP